MATYIRLIGNKSLPNATYAPIATPAYGSSEGVVRLMCTQSSYNGAITAQSGYTFHGGPQVPQLCGKEMGSDGASITRWRMVWSNAIPSGITLPVSVSTTLLFSNPFWYNTIPDPNYRLDLYSSNTDDSGSSTYFGFHTDNLEGSVPFGFGNYITIPVSPARVYANRGLNMSFVLGQQYELINGGNTGAASTRALAGMSAFTLGFVEGFLDVKFS